MYHCTQNNLSPQPLFHVPLCIQKSETLQSIVFRHSWTYNKKKSCSKAVTLTYYAFTVFLISYINLVPIVKLYILQFQMYMHLMSVGNIKIPNISSQVFMADVAQMTVFELKSLWIWRHRFPPKCQNKPNILKYVKNHKTIIWNFVYFHTLHVNEGFWC